MLALRPHPPVTGMPMDRQTSLNQLTTTAHALDAKDPLASFRRHFVVDDPEPIYLDGNSLGRLLHAAVALTHDLAEQQ